ncbi:putative pumilio homolog 8, chloroplastic [Salvia splendens]|uniref:putative pumilio homolog 8, chloroplastic n=1 Tax=Salvia splendens TaxID=180675 RepID=UPI001C25C912|nr:putative pumilio homolog 8, chloroplastic [Salvia splendens]
MVFMEVKDHICDLMVDQFGNYLDQKFLAICNHEQMTQLLMNVISDEHRFMNICVNTHGSRSVQKLLEYLTTADQRRLDISVLKRITLPLTKDPNGHHVIQCCLKLFTFAEKREFVNSVWYIKILSPLEVHQMGNEGLDLPNSTQNHSLSTTSNSCDDYVSRKDSRLVGVPEVERNAVVEEVALVS